MKVIDVVTIEDLKKELKMQVDVEEIRSIIKNKKRWKAFTLYNQQDPRIKLLDEDEYYDFLLLIELAKESL